MKNLVLLTSIFFVSFMSLSIGQQTSSRSYDHKRCQNSEMKDGHHRGKKCKKMQNKKLRRMAAADGKITPKERRMLRNDRRRIH